GSPAVPNVPPGGCGQVNQVVTHPLQPLTLTAGDDRAIRYLDNRTGVSQVCPHCSPTCPSVPSCVSMAPGVSPVSPPVSGVSQVCPPPPGHDCSLRLWHLGQRTCVQELPAHRKKHEEAVLAVAFHPRRPLSASAGADALAKVFV
ncbi:STRN4 protein, partial [Ptilonorhynchus violaceus]|nr:STRN4 protein [Ptilonorhynchus violaceus]